MAVTLNTAISNPRASKVQKTNFKALPIEKIASNDAQAGMFASAAFRNGIYKGQKIEKTEENVRDLLKAIAIAFQNKKFGAKLALEQVAYDAWKLPKGK